MAEPIPELRTADRFISWGWAEGEVKPLGILLPEVPSFSPKSEAGVLLILRDKLSFASFLDADEEYENYFDSVLDLVKELLKDKIEVSVKPHSASESISERRLAELMSEFPKVNLVYGNKPLRKISKSGLLPVFTYDSTGMLELASKGELFFAHLPKGSYLVKERFASNYQSLQDGELMGVSPRQSALRIRRLLSELGSKEKIEIVESFASGIAFKNRSLLVEIKRLILENSNSNLKSCGAKLN
jgi:hypothetical protein